MSTAMKDSFSNLLEQFRTAVIGDENNVPLAHAALLIAEAETPGLNLDRYEAQLDEWGRLLKKRLYPAAEPESLVQVVNSMLFEELGFRGNEDEYSDPRNLLLNEVIERRVGIPISLAIIATDVCQRAGVDLRAVGLPGHVVTRLDIEGKSPLFIDVFHGGAQRSIEDLQQIVRSIYGRRTPFKEYFLDPLTPRQILQRLVHNLKGGALRRGDEEQAERAIELLLIMFPWDLDEIRDRGRLRERSGNYTAALADLETYVKFRPDARDTATVTEAAESLRRHINAEAS